MKRLVILTPLLALAALWLAVWTLAPVLPAQRVQAALDDCPPPRVLDVNGNEQSWNWLMTKYPGVRYVCSAQPQRFKLETVRETIGPAAVVVRVYDKGGQPSANYVGLYWPVSDPAKSTAGALDRWQSTVGAIQLTDANTGHTGFGLGTGSYIKGDKGPHWAWVLSPSAGSDALADFGMLGGTDHACPCSLDFRLAEAQPTPVPTATPTPVPTVAPTPQPLGGRYWLRWGPFRIAVELEARP